MYTLDSLNNRKLVISSVINSATNTKVQNDMRKWINTRVNSDEEEILIVFPKDRDPYPDYKVVGKDVPIMFLEYGKKNKKGGDAEKTEEFYKCPSLATIADLVAHDQTKFYMFGAPNEIEYSANIVFDGDFLKLPTAAEDENKIYLGWRDYYTIDTALFYDDTNIYYNIVGEDERHVSNTVVLRADRDPRDSNSPMKLTAKMRLYRRNFHISANHKITLCGSIEVPYTSKTMLPVRYNDSTGYAWLPRGNKSLLLLYWLIRFTLINGERVLVRVAFRQPVQPNVEEPPVRVPKSSTRCNIECETRISGDLFVRILRILHVYYQQQFSTYDGQILPYREDMRPETCEELNDEERMLASTYEHVPWSTCNDEEEIECPVSPRISTLVRFLGLLAYANYDPSGTIINVDDDIEEMLRNNEMQRVEENGTSSNSGVSTNESSNED